mmetsp:Transcript_2402/g.3223  ORF Transcript_2402/g.3223 Transcript_2402/m.3223 type:complete len:83 (-) Transcript_2402:1800-2048(-)
MRMKEEVRQRPKTMQREEEEKDNELGISLTRSVAVVSVSTTGKKGTRKRGRRTRTCGWFVKEEENNNLDGQALSDLRYSAID